MIRIMLDTPARVWIESFPDQKPGGIKLRPQSLWLLLRLWLATQSADGSGWVRAIEIRERFATAQNLRMLISRAFADFERLGLRAGWGKDRSIPCELLGQSRRSQGPFWLAAGESQKLNIFFRNKAASATEVAIWLQQKLQIVLQGEATDRDGHYGSAQRHAEHASPAYWHAWAGARGDMQDGLLIVDGERGALAGYRRAQALTANPWLKALALLQQAMVWRRAGNADAANTTLNELNQHWHDEQAPEHAWLGAMAAIVRAWCAYAKRDVDSARLILSQASADPRWSGLFHYHPRVRTENANLQALIYRSTALDDRLSWVDRQAGAYGALKHYQLALALANESELFDSAASAASNLGWSLWLFQRAQLKLDAAVHGPPLAWISLAGWLGERFSVRGGCWNSIYLLRMVREGGPSQRHPSLQEFRRWPVLSPKQVALQTGSAKGLRSCANWLELANALQMELDAGRMQVDALQRANLLLEIAWFEAHQGELARSANAVLRLRRRLRELTPIDRAFFREALRTLPE